MRIAIPRGAQRLRVSGRNLLLAAALAGLGGTAGATGYSEGPVLLDPVDGHPFEANDFSSSSGSPTDIGVLTRGSNIVSGATVPYGPVADPRTGALANEDNDYFSFTVPQGAVLTHLILLAPDATGAGGSTISPGDRGFTGLASGVGVTVTPPSSAGLLGFTLLPADAIGTDILPAIGLSSPPGFSGPPFSGATTFTGPLSSGTYTLWLVDGNRPFNYRLDFQVASVPEPGSWILLLSGFALVGRTLRRRRRDITAITA